MVGAVKTETDYYNGAGPRTPHGQDGTLGAHEARHVESLKRWWTTANIREVVADSDMSTPLRLPADASDAQIQSAVRSQMKEIGWTLGEMGKRWQSETIDLNQELQVPFFGMRR